MCQVHGPFSIAEFEYVEQVYLPSANLSAFPCRSRLSFRAAMLLIVEVFLSQSTIARFTSCRIRLPVLLKTGAPGSLPGEVACLRFRCYGSLRAGVASPFSGKSARHSCNHMQFSWWEVETLSPSEVEEFVARNVVRQDIVALSAFSMAGITTCNGIRYYLFLTSELTRFRVFPPCFQLFGNSSLVLEMYPSERQTIHRALFPSALPTGNRDTPIKVTADARGCRPCCRVSALY